jgi:hypothetical protein
MKKQKKHTCKFIMLISLLVLGLNASTWAAEFHLTNGDKVTGEPVDYDGKTYRVKSEYGILSIPAEKVATILFNPEGGTVMITERSEPGQDSITGKIESLQNGAWKIVTVYGYIIVSRLDQIKQITTQAGVSEAALKKIAQLRSQLGTVSSAELKDVGQKSVQAAEFYLTNGDKVSGEPVAYDGKTYRVKSEYGVLSVPAERVLTILFNPEGGTVVIAESLEKPGQDTLSGKIESLQNGEWKIVTSYGYSIVKDFEQIKQINTQAGSVQVTAGRVALFRSQPGEFSGDELKTVFQDKGLRDSSWNPDGDFPNKYELQTLNSDKVVIDHASGLMWQQSGSSDTMTWDKAQEYIKQLNNNRYAGFADWRLPTIEELASLLEPTQKSGDLYIDPLFGTSQTWCWSADQAASGAVWVVRFSDGHVGYGSTLGSYVRAVRWRQ